MCYFDQKRWKCGYWKWSHFRQQCPKEYRTGETCGLKLVYQVYDEEDKCKLCYDMDKKVRRIEKMNKDISRWQREGNRKATIERTQEDLSVVQRQLDDMTMSHWNRVHGLPGAG